MDNKPVLIMDEAKSLAFSHIRHAITQIVQLREFQTRIRRI